MRHTTRCVGSLAMLVTVAIATGCKSYRSSVVGPNTASHGGTTTTRGGGNVPPPPPPPVSTLVITTLSLGNGSVGTFYGGFITASGGDGSPLTFRLIAGSVPAGLTLARSFGVQSTSLSGTPTTVQTSNFTVQVADQTGHTASHAFTLTIDAAQPLVITNQSPILAP